MSPVNSDLERCLSDFPRLRRKPYRPQLEQVAESEPIVAAIPVVVDKPGDRGPLVITSRQLLFIGQNRRRIVVPLHAIHETRVSWVRQLHVYFDAEEAVIGLPGVTADAIGTFLETLGEAADAARRLPTEAPGQAAPSDPGELFGTADATVLGLPGVTADAIGRFVAMLGDASGTAGDAPARAPASPAASSSEADELLKFAALMDRGLLTGAEFSAKKAQLLGLDVETVVRPLPGAAPQPPSPARPAARSPAPLPRGAHVVGPANGSLKLRVGSEGMAAARFAGDLLLEVTSWNASLVIGDSSSAAELTADPGSIKVRECIGRRKPLRERDRRTIEKGLARDVLGTSPISFRSTDVQIDGNRLIVSGALSIAGRSNDVSIPLGVGPAGTISGEITISQRSFGIKPPEALLGALRVSDDVTILVAADG